MRKVLDTQLKIGELDIGDNQFDLQSRDEIAKLLMAFRAYIVIKKSVRKFLRC